MLGSWGDIRVLLVLLTCVGEEEGGRKMKCLECYQEKEESDEDGGREIRREENKV